MSGGVVKQEHRADHRIWVHHHHVMTFGASSAALNDIAEKDEFLSL